jgi:hypothetical protein
MMTFTPGQSVPRRPEHQCHRFLFTALASTQLFSKCDLYSKVPPLPQTVLSSKHKFLHLVDPGFACVKEMDNMCTLTCSTGFFASDKGHGMQLNLRLVRDVLMFYPEGEHSHAIFTLPLLHAESVQQEDSANHSPSSCVVVLLSQFRQCVTYCNEASPCCCYPVTIFACIIFLSPLLLHPRNGAKN